MGRKRIYESDADRQAACRKRVKDSIDAQAPTIDFDKPLEGIIEYFKRMTGLVPSKEQEEILTSMANLEIKGLLCSCGRGFSKTLDASVFALWLADEYSRFTKRPLRILLISSQQEIYTHIDRVFLNHLELKPRLRIEGRSLEIPAKEFEFRDTRSRVTRVVPTGNSIRSHRCDILIIDESASIPTQIINTALACLTGDINKVVLISTPHRERSLFNDYVKRPPEGWVLKQFSSRLCPWMTETIKRLEQSYSKAEQRVEIDGMIPEEEILPLFSVEDIDVSIENFVGLSGSSEAIMKAGIDVGFGKNDRSLLVLTIVEELKGYIRIIFIKSWNSDTIERFYEECSVLLREYNIGSKQIEVRMDSKPSGFNSELKKFCPNLEIRAVDASAHSGSEGLGPTFKELLVGRLYNVIKTHHLKVSSKETELIRQLRAYRRNLQYYDDYVDSLCLAIADLPSLATHYGRVIGPWSFNTEEKRKGTIYERM